MSNYKINIDKPDPSKEETNKFMDFDNLAKDFETAHKPFEFRKRLFKDRKLIRLFMIIVAVLLALLFSQNEETEQSLEEEQPEIYFEPVDENPSNTSN